jgi:FMN hydrolase / 5-amino-6-(5-phospho-D-ribitylamino)uracil phosphatase
VLLLDVMDTLVVDPFFSKALPELFGCSFEELLAAKHPTAWLDFEKGLIDEETYEKRAFTDGRAYDHDAMRALMVAGYEWVEGIPELLTELCARGVETHALSNYPVWYRLIDEKLGLSRYCPWTFVSCKTGFRKPHPWAYLGAAEALDRAPAECLFVDDREGNCAGAREVGMQAHRFTDADTLRAHLVELALL